MAEVVQLIQSVGFPIAACCALFWFLNKEGESHAEETEILREAINNNSVLLQKILDVMKNE